MSQYVIFHNGLPVATSGNKRRAEGYAKGRAGSPRYLISDTGKVMRMIGARPVFTGWEVRTVEALG